jgi:hypothetical protein
MADEILLNQRIDQLDLGEPKVGDYGIFRDMNAAKTKRYLIPIGKTTQNFEWISDNNPGYALNDVVTYGGNWYQSLIADNLNIVPGTDPTKWQLVSKSVSGDWWKAGTYSEDKPWVLSDYDGKPKILVLASAVRPYVSSDIEAETAAGDWVAASEIFPANVNIVLEAGKTFGKYKNGDVAPWAGMTAIEAILDAVLEYINPAFTSFTITGQSTTVEVGTTLSGIKTFTWAITQNSGEVLTIDIYDITAGAVLLAGTINDGTQDQAITNNKLDANGATQSWKGVAHDTEQIQDINSNSFTVTARYYRFAGPVAAIPADGVAVRALPFAFQTGAGTMILNTGAVEKIFAVAVPPGFQVTTAFDLDALNAPLNYALVGTRNVTDAGGTVRVYNLYVLQNAAPYSGSHRHEITIAAI